MKKPLESFIAAGVLSLVAGNACAYTVTHSFTWATPNCPHMTTSEILANPALGKSAGTCTYTYPDNRPLTQAKTLMVDNHLSVGSVLYSWDYNNFLPNFGWSCTSSGIKQCANTIKSNTGIVVNDMPYRLASTFLSGATLISPGIYKTSIEGIGIKFYLKVSGDTSYNTTICNAAPYTFLGMHDASGSYITNPGAGSEIVLGNNPLYSQISSYVSCEPNTNSNIPGRNLHLLKGKVNYSIRAELIKTGDITSFGALSVIGASTGSSNLNPNPLNLMVPASAFINGNAINIQQVSCRLRGATDYIVELGHWVNMASSAIHPGVSLPVSGNVKPVNLNLECSGKLDNVEFSFQDTGASPLTNRNISVYDSAGGQPIEGLEIEMLYNDTRLDVHKLGEDVTTYKTDTGAHGAIKTNPSDTSFNSQSQAQFGARFVQRSAIKRNGTLYTGPVTGKVNMFVTYQ